ncbi:hypothetical protein Gasu_36890 isoform 1 [Galdieria sulphuraria]|uniref:AB hydrolase-1 domain-containing protein n=1 Tax=Galdieria sulphuraria TaxID=130081 RepID=M2XYY4_GALSU|nr:hypothetical protein Gasu_36890 isoform 1 [Galdieria sulphuraria]EME28794.1 hypothetical protein isoform 1 [Galdieria sulphuraria]|eukprot:XP_005705314.1 hypothetical protein isoform 1 [Galdieria sulphuraria]
MLKQSLLSFIELLPLATILKRKGFSVSNFGYPSRDDFIINHARNLIDVLNSLSSRETRTFHFVTHSLGAIILRTALAQPNCPETAKSGRLVLLAPPLKGSKFARYLQSRDLGGKLPKWMETTSKWIVGDCTGRQLMTMSVQEFDDMPYFPSSTSILVIAAEMGRLNPLLEGRNDGVLEVEETMLGQPHYRLLVRGTHNSLLFQPKVIECILNFLCEKKVSTDIIYVQNKRLL